METSRIACDLSGRDRWMVEAFASTSDAVFVADTNGVVTFINKRASELSGWSEGEAVGKPVGEIVRFSIDDDIQTILSSSPYAPAQSPQEFSGKISLVRKDESKNPITGRAFPFFDDGNRKMGTLILLRDATVEHRLVQAKDHFLSIVAHQL